MRTSPFYIFFLLLAVTSCTSPAEPPQNPEVGSIVPIGQPEIRDLSPTTETVPNCSGSNTTTVKHPSVTAATSHAIEWEVGGEAGVGVTIGEGVLPVGVNLSGALSSATTSGLNTSIEKTDGWELPAEPNTIHQYTIMWREVWQPGYVNVVLPNGENIQINVIYRTGIQSDIIGDQVLDCDNNQITTKSTPLPAATPPVVATPTQEVPGTTFGPNLVSNSGFESALDGSGWEWSDQIALVEGYAGNFAVSSTKTQNGGFEWVGITQIIPVTAGKKYTYSAMLNWQNATQVHMKINWYNDALDQISSTQVMPGTDGTSNGWTKRGGTAVAPTGATSARIYVLHGVANETSVPGGVVWVDEVIFAEVIPESNACKPDPSLNLIELWNPSSHLWSLGIWGTPNIVNFTNGLATIDSSDPDFSDFQIWISPCNTQTHNYSNGVQFWPLGTYGQQIPNSPITLGQLAVIDYIPANSGSWSLGNSR